jgi:hypothetical protein
VRKLTFGGANSLDNYLARPDHAVDWLLWGDEAAAVMADYWKTVGTVLVATMESRYTDNGCRLRTSRSPSKWGNAPPSGCDFRCIRPLPAGECRGRAPPGVPSLGRAGRPVERWHRPLLPSVVPGHPGAAVIR